MAAAPGGVEFTPAKRWTDATELLGIADLNAMGQPLARLGVDSVGTDEFINADVEAMINEQTLGLTVTYTFPSSQVVPISPRQNYELVRVALSGIRVDDPVWVSPVDGLDIHFYGLVWATDVISLKAFAVAGAVTIPAGTVLTMKVFTPRRSPPRGTPGGPPNPLATDTGYLTVTRGKTWKTAVEQPPRGEPISLAGLDATATGIKMAVKIDSIGRRELEPAAIEFLTSAVVGGIGFSLVAPPALTIPPNGYATLPTITVAGALTTHIAVMAGLVEFPTVGNGGGVRWCAYVVSANTVQIYGLNLTTIGQTIAAGKRIFGRLL